MPSTRLGRGIIGRRVKSLLPEWFRRCAARRQGCDQETLPLSLINHVSFWRPSRDQDGSATTSAATVTRLSTHLGFEGYPALRAALAMEVGRGLEAGWASDIGLAIGPADPPEQVLNVLASTQANLSDHSGVQRSGSAGLISEGAVTGRTSGCCTR